jgi:hypothetical protein
MGIAGKSRMNLSHFSFAFCPMKWKFSFIFWAPVRLFAAAAAAAASTGSA